MSSSSVVVQSFPILVQNHCNTHSNPQQECVDLQKNTDKEELHIPCTISRKEETVILYFPVNHCKFFKLRTVQLLDHIVTSTEAVADNLFSVVCSCLVMSISVLSFISYSMCLFVHYFLFSHPWDNNFAILDKNIAKFFSLYSLHSIYTQRVKTCQNLTRTLPLIKMHQLQLVKLGGKTPGLTANLFNDIFSHYCTLYIRKLLNII